MKKNHNRWGEAQNMTDEELVAYMHELRELGKYEEEYKAELRRRLLVRPVKGASLAFAGYNYTSKHSVKALITFYENGEINLEQISFILKIDIPNMRKVFPQYIDTGDPKTPHLKLNKIEDEENFPF